MAQIILVMIRVVLPPAGEDYCCMQKASVETVSTAISMYSKGFVETVPTAKSKPQELRFGVDQTMIQMKVLTKGFGDPMVKFKVMVKRKVAVQIIVVMIWVVLPPVGQEYCCIQRLC